MALTEALKPAGNDPPVGAYTVLKGIGYLRTGAGDDSRYEAEILVQLFISGLLTGKVR